jgi:hypothetical protein
MATPITSRDFFRDRDLPRGHAADLKDRNRWSAFMRRHLMNLRDLDAEL